MRQRPYRHVGGALAAVLLLCACACSRETEPNARALAQVLDRRTPPPVVARSLARVRWKDVRQFHRTRESLLVWTRDGKLTPRFFDLLSMLESSSDDGLNPADYDVDWLREQRDRFGGIVFPRRLGTAESVVELELRCTAAALRFARDLSLGRFDPIGEWRVGSDLPDFRTMLGKAVADRRLRDLPESLRPAHGEYHALLKLRQQFVDLVASGGWPRVPGRRRVRDGESDASIPAVRTRLAATGDLRRRHVNDSRVLDAPLSDALELFQRRHGLEPTGWLDAATRDALNVTAERQLQQIDVNLDRWRFARRDLGQRHIRVNIPDFHLGVIEHGRTVLGMRVIVGERERQTPIFSDEISHIVFNPYWNIPESIANDETLPAMLNDPEYLLRNNIEVVRVSEGRVEPVDPAEIDWTMTFDESLRFRQRPGADNALGLVKFMFPNHSSVYLHDTPADRLFSRLTRTLSHGCVRVERPVDLAHTLLEGYGWDVDRITAAMHGQTEQWIRLKQRVPVHLMYFTVWVDGSGRGQFRNDVYGHDQAQTSALERRERYRRRGGNT